MLGKIYILLVVSILLVWSNIGVAQTSGDGAVHDQLLAGQNSANANAGTVTIMTTRNLGSAYMQMALDLSTLLDEGEYFEKMRVIPMVARGKVQNLWDILYLKGVDVGFVQADSLEYLKNIPQYASIKQQLRYIAVMPPEEVHIIAHKSIGSLRDLAGKTISINAKGTGSSVVGTLLFRRLGIPAKLIHEDTRRAIARIKSGEIAAHINVLGKPARPVLRIKSEGMLHLLTIPYSNEVQELYIPSVFTSKDYPELVAPGQEVQTIAARNVLAVYNWKPGSKRYRKVARFVNAFFSRFGELRQKGFQQKWKSINLAATINGWKRFKPAQDWLNRNQRTGSAPQARSAPQQNQMPPPNQAQPAPQAGPATTAQLGEPQFMRLFQAFLKERNPTHNPSEAEQKELYKTFLQWQQRNQQQ